MSKGYNVTWAGVAENDLLNIVEYIAEDRPQNVLQILTKIKKHASSLYSLPERGIIVPELYDQGILLYRELIVAPWRLIYRIAGQEIFILSVIDSRRNVEDILLKRLIDKE